MVLLAIIPIILMFFKIIPQNITIGNLGNRSISALTQVIDFPISLGRGYHPGVCRIPDGRNEFGLATKRNKSDDCLPMYSKCTILPVMVSKLASIAGLWVLKLIFPIMFSLVPLAVYEMLKTQFSDKTAFLSSFFAISL